VPVAPSHSRTVVVAVAPTHRVILVAQASRADGPAHLGGNGREELRGVRETDWGTQETLRVRRNCAGHGMGWDGG
jgi:hypothetical protein